ncbi:MAG: hypothetical protein MUE36_07015 [Acidimicrobiales bacterium]|jgi:hypothetical protein|nr:hypothetical protein [Acidimicrobiales bacterium]
MSRASDATISKTYPMIIAAVLILIPVLLLVWLVLTIDKGVLQLRRIADELQRQRESKPSV